MPAKPAYEPPNAFNGFYAPTPDARRHEGYREAYIPSNAEIEQQRQARLDYEHAVEMQRQQNAQAQYAHWLQQQHAQAQGNYHPGFSGFYQNPMPTMPDGSPGP